MTPLFCVDLTENRNNDRINGCDTELLVQKTSDLLSSSLRAIRTVKKRIIFTGWNKDDRPESKRYKPYKMGTNQYGCVICRWYHILELELDGEIYGVYFPPYERPAFEAATGLKAE